MSNEAQDQQWLDALAGRAEPTTPAAREAAALRRAMNEQAAADKEFIDVPGRDAEREESLLARARREGLLVDRRAARPWWAFQWNTGLAVAAVAAVAISLGLYVQLTIQPEVVRSSPDGVVRLTAEDPVKLKQELLRDLRAVGVQATGYELLGRQGVDADLPQPLTEAVREVLRKYRIAEPTDAVLRVEIAPAEAK